MKRSLVRFLLILLALCMTAGLVVSCGEKKEPMDTTPESSAPISTPEEGEAARYRPEQKDYERYELYMIIQTEYHPENREYFESIAGLGGDAISQAFYERDQFLSEHFNISITLEATEGAGENRAPAKIRKAMDANEDLYDVAFLIAGMRQNVPYGDFLDVSSISSLNLEASYWDQRIQQDYALDGMLFALEGDYNILDELCAMSVFYNRQLYKDFGYEDTYGSPYSIASTGNWTLDLMLEMMKDTSSGSGDLTRDDRWGCLISSWYGAHTFLVGGGYRITQSVDDSTVCNILDTTYFNRIFDDLNKILNTLYENNREVLWDCNRDVVTDHDDMLEMFRANQALFVVTTLKDGLQFRDMETGYGILPIPKLLSTADGQSEYHCLVLQNYNAPMYFPKTNAIFEHLDTTASIVEAMCYYSKYAASEGSISLYDAFYEKMTVAKLCRTPEDYKMMELIYFSKAFCLESAVEFTDVPKLSMSITEGTTLDYGFEDRYVLRVGYSTLRSNMTTLRNNATATMQIYLDSVRTNVFETTN